MTTQGRLKKEKSEEIKERPEEKGDNLKAVRAEN